MCALVFWPLEELFEHHAHLSPEDIRDNWGTITDREGYAVPANLGDETALFLPFLA